MSEFNGSFLGVRESSSATSEVVRDYAVQRANEKSVGADVAQFFIVFNSKDGSFGLAFSDELKSSLGFDKSYYDLVGGNSGSETLDTNSLVPSDTLTPSEQLTLLNDFKASLDEAIVSSLAEFKLEVDSYADSVVAQKILEIDISEKTSIIDNKLTDALSSIEVFLAAELEEVNLSENAKIKALEEEVDSLKLQLSNGSGGGLSEEQVLELINQNTSSGDSLGVTADEVMVMINNRLDTFSMDINDPANI